MSGIHAHIHNVTEVRLYRCSDPSYLSVHFRDDEGQTHELAMFGRSIIVYDADGQTIIPVHFGDCIWPAPVERVTEPAEPHWIEAGYDNAVALGRLHGRERPDTEEGA